MEICQRRAGSRGVNEILRWEWEFLWLRGRGNGFGSLGDEQDEEAHSEEGAAEEEERAEIAAGFIFDHSDEGGTEKAAEVADGIDKGDAASRGCAAQEGGAEGPEWAEGGFESGEGNDEAHHSDKGTFRPGSEGESSGGGGGGKGDVPAAFTAFIRVAADSEHDEAGGEVGDGIEPADHAVAATGEGFEDCGEPHFVAVTADVQKEVGEAKEPDDGIFKSGGKGVALLGVGFGFFFDEA